MDILKLKSEIEKFRAMTGEDGLLGPGGEEQAEETNFVTDEHAGGAGQAPKPKKVGSRNSTIVKLRFLSPSSPLFFTPS